MLYVFDRQLEIEAKDSGLPTTRSSTNRARVTVTVVRNNNSPIFFNTSYSATIRKDAQVGSQVVVVQATDQDQAVSELISTRFGKVFSCINHKTGVVGSIENAYTMCYSKIHLYKSSFSC